MPLDMWLYNYAKLLFEARWGLYKTGQYLEPDVPPFPKVHCQSTRYVLKCTEPKIHYQWIVEDDTVNDAQAQLLPAFESEQAAMENLEDMNENEEEEEEEND